MGQQTGLGSVQVGRGGQVVENGRILLGQVEVARSQTIGEFTWQRKRADKENVRLGNG